MELVKRSQTLGVRIPDEFKDVFNLQDNLEGAIPRLKQIGIIHRGQLFEMPNGETAKKFEAVIIDQHPANAWWEKDISETGAGAIPDCFSMDGVYPSDGCKSQQSASCKDCDWNQFGSDRKNGKGKDCKNMKRLHVILENSLLPKRITVPPTSIRSFEEYLTELIDRGLPYATCVTEFYLDKKVSEGFEFAEVKFRFVRVLNLPELGESANAIKKYKAPARQQDITADEYAGETDKTEDASFDFGTDQQQKMKNAAEEVFEVGSDEVEMPNSDIPY